MTLRTYYRRRRPVTVNEVDDLVAVRSDSVPREDIAWPGDPGDARAFRQAGWHLVQRGQAEDYAEAAQVVLRNEHLLLAPNRVVVKFRDEMLTPEVEGILLKHDLETIQELTFATNLRAVAKRGAAVDVFEVVDALRTEPGCEFAEPEFIEPIGERSLAAGGGH